MCPPESCCCCELSLGVRIGAGIMLAHVLLSLIAVFAVPDVEIDAFCTFEHLEATSDCGGSCAVHESGAWFTSSPDFEKFSPETVPGYSGAVVPIVPLCSRGSGAQKTYQALGGEAGFTAEEAEVVCRSHIDGSFSLASITSADENERARKACGDNSCWLGLQSATELHWTTPSEWRDGTSFAYANWWPVNQPPKMEDPTSPQLYVFMNVPGAEPGEHCTTLRTHMYFGVFVLLCFGGLSILALVGANSLDGKQLGVAWQGWIGLWFVTLIQSGVETSLYVDLNPLSSTSWSWGFWAFTSFLISAPLNAWWIVSVRSLADQCQDSEGVIQVSNPLQNSSSTDDNSMDPSAGTSPNHAPKRNSAPNRDVMVVNPLQAQSSDDETRLDSNSESSTFATTTAEEINGNPPRKKKKKKKPPTQTLANSDPTA